MHNDGLSGLRFRAFAQFGVGFDEGGRVSLSGWLSIYVCQILVGWVEPFDFAQDWLLDTQQSKGFIW